MLVKDIIRKEYFDNNLIRNFDELLENTKRIESLFRNSREYKNYIAGIREGLQIKNCAFFSDRDFTEVDLELHHIFPKLYDIVLIVGGKMLLKLKDGEFLTVYNVVDEVIKFHMKDFPTVMMLSSTVHQLHHTGQYQLPKFTNSLHIGKYKEVFNEYSEFDR